MFKDPAAEKGRHWTAIWAKRPNQAYYFDSYGDKPTTLITNYLMKNFEKITHNRYKFQNLFSDVCGAYTICFIYFMSLGVDFKSFLTMIRKSNYPDAFVRQFVTNSFH
jgi:hypothetical protein